MARKWEDTKKEKRQYEKISGTLAQKFGYNSNPRLAAAAKAAKNAKSEKIVVKSPAQQAEAEYAKMIKAGKVGPKNVNSVKEKIANKWGVWPNGNVN